MIIRVIYQNGQVGTVFPEQLDALIRNRKIHSFKRSDGWVQVQQGPLRQSPADTTTVAERRTGRQAGETPD